MWCNQVAFLHVVLLEGGGACVFDRHNIVKY